jgi:hypothetical protein
MIVAVIYGVDVTQMSVSDMKYYMSSIDAGNYHEKNSIPTSMYDVNTKQFIYGIQYGVPNAVAQIMQ